MSRFRDLARFAAVPIALIATCAAIAAGTGQDPTVGFELAGAVLFVTWLTHFGRRLRRATAASARLATQSQPSQVGGTSVRLVDIEDPAAFVHGLLRPQIYVSRALVESLDALELRGVLLHERHHRATRAPLRAAALEALDRALGWLPPLHRAVVRRLASLEVEADAAAIGAGVRPATLASALMKCEAAAPAAGIGFATEADLRLETLVAWGQGTRSRCSPSLPIEWAAPLAAMLALGVCHLFGA